MIRKRKIWIGISVFLCIAGLYLQYEKAVYHIWQEHELLQENLLGKIVIIKIPSEYMKNRVKMFVYTPPGYNSTQQRYPVIYMFHGMPGAGRDWFVNGNVHSSAESLMTSGKMVHAIIVGFDCFGQLGEHSHTDYLDSIKGGPMDESFITKELVPFIDSHYRTIANNRNRAIIGLSSGGYGATNVGLKHQDMFLTVVSHSGFFSPDLEDKYFEDILGPRCKVWEDNDPFEFLKSQVVDSRFRVYMDIAVGDDLLGNNRCFAYELRKRHLLGEFHIERGSHKWWFWKNRVRYSLLFVSHRFIALDDTTNQMSH